jgi:hypothetical protein
MPTSGSLPPFASFALPLVAAGAAAAAVALPILIHLLSKQRYQVVPWAAMRFLLAAPKQQRRRIDRWLLLALRVLLLLLPLAAMCAATPWAEALWQRITPGKLEASSNLPRTHHILLVDGSLSMSASTDGGTRFEKALAQLEQFVQSTNAGDGFSLIFAGTSAQPIVPGPTNDREKVLAELRQLRATHASGDTEAALAAVADALGRSPRNYPRRQVTIVSDNQRTAWQPTLPVPDTKSGENWSRILPKADVVFVDAANSDVDNLAVAGLELARPLALVDTPTAITATVHNYGRSDRRSVWVQLLIGRPSAGGPESALVPIEQLAIETLPSGQRATVTFPIKDANRFREAGLHQLQVRLLEPDAVPADDSRTLAFDVRESLPVMVVNGRTSNDREKRASDYVQTALDPSGKRPSWNPARPRTVSLAEFADPLLTDLAGVDCVFLCDLPAPTPAQAARLEAHLKRGGGVVIGLGPNAAGNIDHYNRVLFRDGKGLLPGPILGVRNSAKAGESDYRFAADEAAFRLDPLAAFRKDDARIGLTDVPFQSYLKLDAPAEGRARRILSFVPAKPAETKPGDPPVKPDPAIVEFPRHRGRVIVYCSTFNREWTDWPVLPSFLPMVHEMAIHAAVSPDRHTLTVGEPIEEILPLATVGLGGTLVAPDGTATAVPIVAGDETGLARYPETTLAGLYRWNVGNRKDRLFAANVADGGESDLARIEASALRDLGPRVSVVSDPGELRFESAEGEAGIRTPRPHGPTVARGLLTLALALLALESFLAYRLGPSRNAKAIANAPANETPPMRIRRYAWMALATIPLMLALAAIGTVVHAEATGQFLGFLPTGVRGSIEQALEIPGAAPGEGTRWRMEKSAAYSANAKANRRWMIALPAAAALAIAAVYWLERRANNRFRRVAVPMALRLAAVGLIAFVLLPQVKLAFDREGYPDIAIVLDRSASMATRDELQDPKVRAKAEQLRGQFPGEIDRLRLAKQLLLRPGSDWIEKLLIEKQLKVHLYSMADDVRAVASLDDDTDLGGAREAVEALKPEGASSRLGDGLQAVLKTFRGGSLTAIIAFTDGVTTAGDDLPKAGREAARAGVPLYLVGIGESQDPFDIALSDLKSAEVVVKGDQLVFEAKLTAQGPNVPASVPVVLYERQGEKRIERGRQDVVPDRGGKPLAFRFTHTPTEIGEKTFVIEVPVQAGEAETGNNRLERVVLVTENKKLRVLYVEAYPRYEFRFVKTLLERETESARSRAVDLDVLWLDASAGHWQLDKSTDRLRGALPTRTQLFEYDAIVYGDVNPALLPKSSAFFTDLGEFVREKGGGLVVLAGEHASPHKLWDSPFAELLPIQPTEAAAKSGGPPPTPESPGLREEYLPKPTALGRTHPMLRFSSNDSENERIWNSLKGFYWGSVGYRRKPGAEVLATHPSKPAEGDGAAKHPLILQQFVGKGRVVFLGFDETWRWRFRTQEERFNQFWGQLLTAVAKNRVVRVELKTDKQTAYRRDEPIRLTLRYPDDAPVPEAGAAVRVSLTRKPLQRPGQPELGEHERQTMQLTRVEGQRATFETLLTRTPEGEYSFVMTHGLPPGAVDPPRAEARVLPPPGERDRLEMNRADLARAAAESRGKFYTIADAEKVFDDLPEPVRIPLNQPCPPLSVWNHAAMFGILALLLSGEWWLRRRERLV